MNGKKKILVLGIGNDILCDDAAGLKAVRRIKERTNGSANVQETNGLGLNLLDHLEGYDCALLVDAVKTGKYEPGTILELSADDFSADHSTSPHYAGLGEVIKVAERLQIPFPKEICILALEVEDPYQIHEGLTVAVEKALPEVVEKCMAIIDDWSNGRCN